MSNYASFERSEVELLLEQAEFVVKDVCEDFDFGSYGLENPPDDLYH